VTQSIVDVNKFVFCACRLEYGVDIEMLRDVITTAAAIPGDVTTVRGDVMGTWR